MNRSIADRTSGGRATHHLIAYVQKWRIGLWKRIWLAYGNRDPLFLYGSSDDIDFDPYARKDNVLWIVASYPKAGPSLVARMEIAGRVGQDIPRSEISSEALDFFAEHSHLAMGRPRKSHFFGYNDASEALLQLRLTIGKDKSVPIGGRASKRWRPSYAYSLARPRLIAGGSKGAAPLEKFSEQLRENKVFVSWKHGELWRDRPKVRRLGVGLARAGFDVWWDLLTLPPSTVSKKVKANDDDLLEKLLRSGLRHSRVVLAITSRGYGIRSCGSKSNWTALEWRGGRRPKGTEPLLRTVYPLRGKPGSETKVDLEMAHLTLRRSGPAAAAEEFVRKIPCSHDRRLRSE